MPAFLLHGTTGGEQRDELAVQAGAIAGRIYARAEEQICRLLARLAARVLRGGLQPARARRKLTILGTAILARAARQLDHELVLAERQLRASAASAAAGGLAAIGARRQQEGQGAAADEITNALGRPAAGWGNLRDRIHDAGIAALRSASLALIAVGGAVRVPLGGSRGARLAAQAASVSQALGSLPVQLDAYTDTAGRTWHLSAYVRAAAGAAATVLHIVRQMISLRAAGAGLVIVEPGGGCPKCAPWAGKILSLTGEVPAGTLVTGGTVAGTMAEALAAGVGHPHCRHSFNPVAA